MVKYQLHIRLSEFLALSTDKLSEKLNLSYNGLVMAALNDYVEKHLTQQEQQSIINAINKKNKKWEILQKEDHENWVKHLNSMDEKQLKEFDAAYKEGLKQIERGAKVVGMDKIHGFLDFPMIEQHRLVMLWASEQMEKDYSPVMKDRKGEDGKDGKQKSKKKE